MTLQPSRVLLLMAPTSYRSAAFCNAAERLGLAVVRGLDLPDSLSEFWNVDLPLDFSQPDQAAERVADFVAAHTIAAVLAVDDSATLIAAAANARAGLPHNDPESALAARNKLVMRRRLAAGGVRVPAFAAFPLDADPALLADEQRFPVVLKPTELNGSRGVIRADTPDEFIAAFSRIRTLLYAEGFSNGRDAILVEQYLPGDEVALEGLLSDGELRVLALFDKPDPLVGPYFEETIYVTPSRHSDRIQREIAACTAASAAALGLRDGPVHAELRINDEGVWPIELAGRSIGGLCSTILEFGSGASLEELILRHATGMELPDMAWRGEAAGVMMIPIPRAGILKRVDGQDDARAVPGITGLEITATLNAPITPLPEGSAYLGFIFARAATPAKAEEALRIAHARLTIRIDPVISLATAN